VLVIVPVVFVLLITILLLTTLAVMPVILASLIFCATRPTLKLACEVDVVVVAVSVPVVNPPDKSVTAVPATVKLGSLDDVVFVTLTLFVSNNIAPMLLIPASLICCTTSATVRAAVVDVVVFSDPVCVSVPLEGNVVAALSTSALAVPGPINKSLSLTILLILVIVSWLLTKLAVALVGAPAVILDTISAAEYNLYAVPASDITIIVPDIAVESLADAINQLCISSV